MEILGLLLIHMAGHFEHLKDLSEEGKLKGYLDKDFMPNQGWCDKRGVLGESWLWWKVHWLQGSKWDWIPVWIRQYLPFRDGWHLLKFGSLTLGTLGYVLVGASINLNLHSIVFAWVLCRLAFSLPETYMRYFKIWTK